MSILRNRHASVEYKYQGPLEAYRMLMKTFCQLNQTIIPYTDTHKDPYFRRLSSYEGLFISALHRYDASSDVHFEKFG